MKSRIGMYNRVGGYRRGVRVRSDIGVVEIMVYDHKRNCYKVLWEGRVVEVGAERLREPIEEEREYEENVVNEMIIPDKRKKIKRKKIKLDQWENIPSFFQYTFRKQYKEYLAITTERLLPSESFESWLRRQGIAKGTE